MHKALLRAIRAALFRRRTRSEITRVQQRIVATCAAIESHQQALRFASLTPAARREHRNQLHALMGTTLPQLSLRLSDLRLSLRTGLPPVGATVKAASPQHAACKPMLAQVQPLPASIAVLRRRERAA